jgi:hypothetical protein
MHIIWTEDSTNNIERIAIFYNNPHHYIEDEKFIEYTRCIISRHDSYFNARERQKIKFKKMINSLTNPTIGICMIENFQSFAYNLRKEAAQKNINTDIDYLAKTQNASYVESATALIERVLRWVSSKLLPTKCKLFKDTYFESNYWKLDKDDIKFALSNNEMYFKLQSILEDTKIEIP